MTKRTSTLTIPFTLGLLAAAALLQPAPAEAWRYGPGAGPPGGYGYGPGYGPGYRGPGPGYGSGYGPGYNNYGPGYGSGYGPGPGYGYGPGPGYGYGPGPGYGAGYGPGFPMGVMPGMSGKQGSSAFFSDQEVAKLKQGLAVTPQQEPAWNALVAAFRALKPTDNPTESPEVKKAYDDLLAVLDPSQRASAESFRDSMIW